MIRKYRVRMLCATMALLPCLAVSAYGQDGDADSVNEEIKALRQQVDLLSSAVLGMKASMDTQFKKVLTELAAVKKAAAAPSKKKRAADTKVYDVKIEGKPFLGPKDAAVTIVEFSDFQCGFCVKEPPKIKQVLKDYPNDVKLVFINYPLSFHKKAKPAAAATVLAFKEKGNDAFWEMHDKIFAGGTKKLDIPVLRSYAEDMGLDLAAFDAVMADPAKIDAQIADDMAEAKRCGVRGTPTVLVNGLKLASRTPAGYKARIEEILKKKGKAKT